MNELLRLLEARFKQHAWRHPGIAWNDVRSRLESAPEAFAAVRLMEATGGEPDVILLSETDGSFAFIDCSAESPIGRRSLCYDPAALEARKAHKPDGSALGKALEMGVEMMTEDHYQRLQSYGQFDCKTSSWIATPDSIRALGGALFCDRRYNRVFTYHNGAQSYYAARGFRGLVRL
ncbi:DUF4256 domain-containing protein [Stutzerimonas stutzeri]